MDVTEHPTVAKWVQFPKALFVFLVVPADPESGAFYIYDRHSLDFSSVSTTRIRKLYAVIDVERAGFGIGGDDKKYDRAFGN